MQVGKHETQSVFGKEARARGSPTGTPLGWRRTAPATAVA